MASARPSEADVSFMTRQDVLYNMANDPEHSRSDKAGRPSERPIPLRFCISHQKQKREPPNREGACRPIQGVTNADHLFTPLVSTKDALAQHESATSGFPKLGNPQKMPPSVVSGNWKPSYEKRPCGLVPWAAKSATRAHFFFLSPSSTGGGWLIPYFRTKLGLFAQLPPSNSPP
jgi:hypothetical protein